MLSRLTVHLRNGYNWPDLAGRPCARDENANLPAGYTYLAQFVAHDLVHSVAPLPGLGEPTDDLARDFRAMRMVLETIYGGGPTARPGPYAIDGFPPERRRRLRLGHVPRAEPGFGTGVSAPMLDKPARDIPRAQCPYLNDRGRQSATDALIADPRNDDNLIVGQLTAMFHELHNIVLDEVDRLAEAPHQGLDDFSAFRSFLAARKVVAYVYRGIVVNDLLKRMLHPAVHGFYTDPARSFPKDFADDPSASGVPCEFSHAVFRFGHVMTRFNYPINDHFDSRLPGKLDASMKDILDRTSARSLTLMPLACNWLVDWSRFFELDRIPTYSRAIRPFTGRGHLTNNTYFPNELELDGGIFLLDMLRGVSAGVRTVSSLAARIDPAFRAASPLLSDSAYRAHAIGKWLTQQRSALHGSERQHALADDELALVSRDPPLFFYTLFEAADEAAGRRLGILGSVIVAEVVFGALHTTRAVIEGDRTLEDLVDRVFERNAPRDMPQLIRFIQRKGGLAAVDCGA